MLTCFTILHQLGIAKGANLVWSESILIFIFGICVSIIGYLLHDKLTDLENAIDELRAKNKALVTDLMTEEKIILQTQYSLEMLKKELKDIHAYVEHAKTKEMNEYYNENR